VGFQIDDAKKIIQLAIGDRGQGIISSLQSVVGLELSPQDILHKAFNEKISGRAPEKRGNGLKFVLKQIEKNCGYLY
jgi:sensor histidine kinase regulating citrate/malate metabolism